MSRLLALLLALFLMPAFGQETDSQAASTDSASPNLDGTPTRQPAAVAAVESAVAALGGSAAVGSILDSVSSGSIDPPPDSKAEPRTFVWKVAGEEFRREFKTASGTEVYVSGHGQAESTRGGKTRRIHYHVAHASPPLHLPALVLAKLLTERYTLISLGMGTAQGRPAIVVRSLLESDVVARSVTLQKWFFDAESGLPLRVEYRMPANSDALKTTEASADFSDYRSLQGVLVPFRIVVAQGGSPPHVITVSTVEFNTGISPSEFDAAGGGGQ